MKHDGAKVWPQRFPEEAVSQWKILIQKMTSELASFIKCWDAFSITEQLAAMKKIAENIQKSSLQGALSLDLLQIVIEMHLYCASRHPLQRLIASILQDLPQPYEHSVTSLTSEILKRAMTGLIFDKLSKQLHYIQSLMENYVLGEMVLLNSLPLLLQFFDLQLEVVLKGGSKMYDDVILVMKTLTNVLHKYSKIENFSVSSSILWPPAVEGQLVLVSDKLLWINMMLSSLQIKAESALFSDDFSHDVVLSAGMLCTVLLVLIASSNSTSVEVVRTKVQSWLEQQNCVLFTRLAVCHSLLAKLPCIFLLSVIINQKSLLLALFPIICDLFGSITETPDRYLAARTLALWASVAKDCSAESFSLTDALHPEGEIIPILLQFVWTLWEDPVNGVRHQCQSIFMDIIAIYKVLKSDTSEKYLLSLLECLLRIKNSTRGKYTLLASLSHHINVHHILRLRPGLPQELMDSMGHQALACHAGELWSELVKLYWSSGCSNECWQKIWIETLIKALCFKPPLARQHIVQHCLASIFECDENSIANIEKSLTCLQAVTVETRLMVLLTCLRAARTTCKDFRIEEKYSSVLINAMHHGDEQVQLSMLGLICESRRTTELPHPAALDLVLQFVHLNGNTQSTGFRYDIVTCIRKFLHRIRDGWCALVKQPEREQSIGMYKKFLENLLNQQFEALQPLSAFQRREMALLVLNAMQDTFRYDSSQTPLEAFVFSDAMTIPFLHCLMFSLLDSYSANKSVALDIILKFPKALITLQDNTFLIFVERFFELVRSPKAADCTSAAYLLKCFIYHDGHRFSSYLQEIVNGHNMNNSGILLSTVDYEPPIAVISILLQILQWQLKVAETNLLKASISAPMYGSIQAIHAALESTDLSCQSTNESFKLKPVICLVLLVCKKISNLVSPVVCNSSPEGFLPSNQQSLDSLFVDSSCGNTQSLLLCCWHCMKEISLLLGHIVETASLGEWQILSPVELSSIGDMFIQQLTEARHRGAFEMAFSGFTKLCQRLWSCPFSELKAKTSLWIDDLLSSLQSTSITKLLNITRRSAGLPFYVQAILITEPKHSGFECFNNVMKTLLTVAENWNVHQSFPEEHTINEGVEVEPSAVHALNILRALYRDSILGQRIVPYIPRGIILAVEGFSSSFWPIRNSSTMLLSAVVTRIFGVKKVQDEHSTENKITAKEFFTRFPTLRKFILMKLEAAEMVLCDTESVDDYNTMLQPSLFAVLLILSRLYPSPVDNKDAMEYMESFLPPLLSCTRSSVWKTRELVSCAILSAVPANQWTPVVVQVIDSLNTNSQNQIHGLLLVLKRLLFDHPDGIRMQNDNHNVASILTRLLGIRNLSLWNNSCIITQSLYVEVVTRILRLIPCSFDLKSTVPDVIPFVYKALPLLSQKQSNIMFKAGLLASVTELLLLFASNSVGWNIVGFPPYNQLIVECCNHCEAEIRKYGIDLLQSLPRDCAADVQSLVFPLLSSEKDEDVLIKLCRAAVAEVSQSNSFKDNNVQLHKALSTALDMVQRLYGRIDLKLALMEFISVSMTVTKLCQESKYGWMKFLQKMGSESNPVELRQAVAHVLKDQWMVDKDDSTLMQYYWLLTLTLLQDPAESIRNEMAKSISNTLSKEMVAFPGYAPNPCPPAALKWTVQAMIQLAQTQLDPNVEILISIVKNVPVVDSHPTFQTILFDEDPVNTYAEQWILFEVIIGTLSSIKQPTENLKLHIDSLVEASISFIKCNREVGDNPYFPFINSFTFLHLLKSFMVVHMCSKEMCVRNNNSLNNVHPLLKKYL